MARNNKLSSKKGKKAYISWEYNDMEFSHDEETNICLIGNHQDEEVTSYFSYQDIICICKKLTKGTNQLEKNSPPCRILSLHLNLKIKTLKNK